MCYNTINAYFKARKIYPVGALVRGEGHKIRNHIFLDFSEAVKLLHHDWQ